MTSPGSRPARLLIVAAAGYGKTTVLESERPPGGEVCTAADALAHGLPEASWIGIDALEEVDVEDQRELLEQVHALPAHVGFSLATRTPLDPHVRETLCGQVFERGPADLALEPYAVARLLADEYGVTDPDAAPRVVALTGGWPALVHFAGDALGRRPDEDLTQSLTHPSSSAATWVTANVLAGVPEDVLGLLGVVAAIGPVTDGVCERVADHLGLRSVAGIVDRWCQQGVLVPRGRPGDDRISDFVPLVGRVLAAHDGAQPVDASMLRAAAAAYETDDLPFAAARTFALAGAHRDAERLLAERGADMVRRGDARGVADLIADHPLSSTPGVRQAHADALRRLGDGPAARRALGPLVTARNDSASAHLATLMASALYTEGDLDAALEALDGVDVDAVRPDLVGVEWRACRVQVLSMLGRRDEARAVAAEALRVAESLDEPDALAAAHLASSRTTTGARKEAHLDDALRAATKAGDVVTAALVQVNRSHLLLAGARYADAVVAGREALRLAEMSSPTGRLSAALHNLGEALGFTGEYEEARWHLQRAVGHSRRLGPGRTASGLYGIAEIHRQLGHDAQAEAAYDEAIGLARTSGELQVLVPALAGLARLQARRDVGAAAATAGEAEALAPPALLPLALVAVGWVALGRGEPAEAAGIARRAVEAASTEQAFDLLAGALELLGSAGCDPADQRDALSKARSIWSDGGAGTAAARVDVLLGGLPGADGVARSRARDAVRLLQRLGVVGLDGRPVTEPHGSTPVRIQVLGGFEVRVGGEPVPLPAWRSRQARTLVKVLASRRGRPVTRDALCELLWPDDDPAKTGHRLSVLLATVRGVLDPGKAWPPDHYVAGDSSGLRLDLTHVTVDADGVLRDAADGADLMEEGEDERAREILADVDARCVGDAFEEDLGEDWAHGLREEVRSAWLRSLRRLATLLSRQGRVDDAQGLLLRLLVVDPYDEQVHRMLVRTLARAGRHGEARRAFRRWRDAMREIDAPLPDPAVMRLTDRPHRQPTTRVRRPLLASGAAL